MTGSYNTLQLDTVANDGGFATFDDGADRITLPAGDYDIEVTAYFHFTSTGNPAIYSRLVRDPDGDNEAFHNMPVFTNTSGYPMVHNSHRVTITKPTEFEIQGYASSTSPVTRYGSATSAPEDLAGQVKIIKLR